MSSAGNQFGKLRDRPGAVARRRLLGWAAAAPAFGLPMFGASVALRAEDPRPQDTKIIRIGSGPTGATEFLFGGLVANAISNPPGSRECDKGGNCGVPGLIAVAQTTGGVMENLRAVAKGDLELGLVQADAASWAYAGAGAFADQPPLSNLRVIARLYPATIHLVVREGAKINGIEDLRGKKVGISMNGSAQAATARQLLSAYDVHWTQLHLKPMPFTTLTDALATDAVDALFLISAAPVLALEDLARRTPIRVVPINGPIADKLAQVLPYYSIGVVPASTYGALKDVPTLDVGVLLVARDTLNEDLGFGIARAIWHDRNLALFQNGHPSGKLMSKGMAAEGFTLPLNRGAARYYLGSGVELPIENLPLLATPDHPASPTRSS